MKVEDTYVLPPRSVISAQEACNMPADEMTSTDILKNPVLIETVSWNTTQAPGTELISFTIPAVFATLDTFHTRMLQIYSYFKPSVQLRFILNSTKFHQGKLIAFYDPMESTSPAGTSAKRRQRNQFMATGQPNVILDAGYSNTGIIEIPFEHVLSYLTTNSQERAPQMGTVYLMVLNTLGVAAGTTPELSIQIMLSCTDVQLHLPMRPHDIQLLSAPLVMEPQSAKPSRGLRKSINAVTSQIMTGPKMMYNTVTGNWNGVKENFGQMWENTISFAEGALQMIGMDKPNDPLNKTNNCLSTTSPVSHMQGVDGSIRLAATPYGGYTKMDFSSTNPGEMNIKQIIKTKMMFRQGNWDTTQVPGTQVFTTFVHPGLCSMTPSIDNPGYTQLTPTFLSYMSLAFEQFHGSINFRFDFTATQFHTGRILAVFEPNSSTTGGAITLNTLTNNPSHLFDLHENKTFEINIPFVSSTPRKSCNNPTSLLFPTDDETSLGRLTLYVYTPLAVSNNLPTSIEFNSYISAGDDFVFEVPRISDEIFYPDQLNIPPITMIMEPQSLDALPLRSEDRSSPPSIIKGSGKTMITAHYNEEIADVRDYVCRYAEMDNDLFTPFVANPGDTGESVAVLAFETTLTTSRMARPAQIPLTFMSSLFTFWSGSLRYKFIPMIARNQTLLLTAYNSIGKVVDAPINGTGGFSFVQGVGSSFPHQIQVSAQDSSVEVEIPFYSYYNQYLTSLVQTTGNFNDTIYGSGTVVFVARTDTPTSFPSSTLRGKLYASAGDDFMLRFLVSPPTTLIRTSV